MTPVLETDKTLAESAAKRAEVLAGLGSLSPDTDFLETDEGKLCGESLIKFDAKTAPGLTAINWQYGTLATDYFYKGSTDYDADNHEVTGSRGYQYASLLWKSSLRVGFGYYGQYVVARYCAKKDTKIEDTPYPKPPEKGLTAYALNVCPEGGCAKCPTPVKGLGYDNCYNARALKYVNNLRKMVGQPEVEIDYDYAIKAQSWANTFNVRGSEATTEVARPDDCASLHFQQTISDRIDTLAESGDA